jgi:hypothetical protein
LENFIFINNSVEDIDKTEYKTMEIPVNLLLTDKTWLESIGLDLQSFDPEKDEHRMIAIHVFGDTTYEQAETLLNVLSLLNPCYSYRLFSHQYGHYIVITLPIIEIVLNLLITIVNKIYMAGGSVFEFQIHLTTEEIATLQTTHDEMLNHLQNINNSILLEAVS